jgi:hypothetical protein
MTIQKFKNSKIRGAKPSGVMVLFADGYRLAITFKIQRFNYSNIQRLASPGSDRKRSSV